MVRKVVILVLVAFFAVGTLSAMAVERGASGNDNALQGMYDWFSSWKVSCHESAQCYCKTCGAQCCKACNSDCGGKCCSACVKK